MTQILVVDDDSCATAALGRLFSESGFAVSTAESGQGAQAILRRLTIDVMVADLLLGDMTAMDLLRKMHERGRVVPTIVVTGHGTIETAVTAMKLGAVDYLLKPYDFEVLLTRVADFVAADVSAHAAHRWAEATVRFSHSRCDARNVTAWGRVVGISAGALRTRCALAGVAPRRALTFARLFRAIRISAGQPWKPQQALDVAEPRTLRRMLRQNRLPEAGPTPTLDEFLARQTLVQDEDAIASLRYLVSRSAITRHQRD